MISYIKGDITKSDCNYICHQVNCQGKMNSGVAKTIRTKWPRVYEEYYEMYKQFREQNQSPLKITLISDISKNQKVANMFAQEFYGYNGQRYTDYEAYKKSRARDYMYNMRQALINMGANQDQLERYDELVNQVRYIDLDAIYASSEELDLSYIYYGTQEQGIERVDMTLDILETSIDDYIEENYR